METVVDLLLDGVENRDALAKAWRRQEAERDRAIGLIERGEYELAEDDGED